MIVNIEYITVFKPEQYPVISGNQIDQNPCSVPDSPCNRYPGIALIGSRFLAAFKTESMRLSFSTCPGGNFDVSSFSQSSLSPLWLKLLIILKIVRHPEGYKFVSSNINVVADKYYLLLPNGTSDFPNVFTCLLLQVVTHILPRRVGDLFQLCYDFRVLFQHVVTLAWIAGQVV